MAQFQVSQSKVKTWRQCRMKYYLRYVEHLKPIVKARPLMFGGLIHEMLEKWTEGEDPFEYLDSIKRKLGKMFAAERELMGEIIDDARVIMESYFDYWQDDNLIFVKINKKRAEHWIEMDLTSDIRFVMKLDAIVKTKSKFRWLLENKTGKNIPDEDQRWRDLQTAVYLRVCEMVGIKGLTGVLWNYIRSKPPTRPQILKSGQLSTKKIETMPAVVMEVIHENKLDPKDSKELLEHAAIASDGWFKRYYTPIHRQVVDMVFNDFLDTSVEMSEKHGRCKQRNIDKHCGWCDYELICRTELTGGDVDFVKEKNYVTSQDEETSSKAEKPGGRKRRTSRSPSK